MRTFSSNKYYSKATIKRPPSSVLNEFYFIFLSTLIFRRSKTNNRHRNFSDSKMLIVSKTLLKTLQKTFLRPRVIRFVEVTLSVISISVIHAAQYKTSCNCPTLILNPDTLLSLFLQIKVVYKILIAFLIYIHCFKTNPFMC